MRIPKRDIGGFAQHIYSLCSSSQKDRLTRGAQCRNLYLQGDENGDPQTYLACLEYIDNLSAYLYSPEELRFAIEFYGASNPVLRAMGHSTSSELHKWLRRSGVLLSVAGAVTWSLVKGKSFIKLLWTENGFQPTLIQPEMMGVLREDLLSLDDQDAFFHTTYLTPDRFRQILGNRPDAEKIYKDAQKYIGPGKGDDSPDKLNNLKQVILGGLNPYQAAGSGGSKQRGWVNWLTGPYPTLAPEILTKLIPLHELWVWDDERGEDGEYTVIQFVGPDCVIEGLERHRNIFADPLEIVPGEKKLAPSDGNPLTGRHPFLEFCPNELDGYFWGRSELYNVAMLQKSINSRVDGINHMLRMQEKPPKFFKGTQGITQKAYSVLTKPGGYLTDNNPSADVKDVAPNLPQNTWESLHEFERMFDKIGGFSPVLRGRGESGVRSQGHAETLVSTASPRFKKRALIIEQQVEAVGSLGLDMLKAHVPYEIEAWVEAKKAGIWEKIAPKNWLEQPPVPGMKSVPFLLHQLPENARVVVDSHSSSPAFSHETRGLMFDLFRSGVLKPEQLVAHTNPPGQEQIIEDIRTAEAEKAAFVQAHPEVAEKTVGKKKKK